MDARTYADAITALNSLQTNFKVVQAIRNSGRGMNKLAIPEMIEWGRKAGLDPSELDRLNPIHIAGTKGKGSTSAFVSSILTQYPNLRSGSASHRVGLYTSPHLRFVRERIRINNEPLSEHDFASYFFAVWDRLEEAAQNAPQPPDEPTKPVYFRFLTLMAFHAYLAEGISSAVIECGIGGEYDSTNIIQHPSVTAITSLGIDHTSVLGATISEIAWHKAGIMKQGAVCFTVAQPGEAMDVLHTRAKEKGVVLKVVGIHPEIADGTARLGLAADFQKINASLAVEVAAEHLRRMGFPGMTTSPLPEKFKLGLQSVQWGGRCEVRLEKGLSWHLDGGHTLESIEVAATWFAGCVKEANSSRGERQQKLPARVLIFNQQTRTGKPLLSKLYEILARALDSPTPFTHVVFCTNTTFKESGFRPDLVSMNNDSETVRSLSVQKELAECWQRIQQQAGAQMNGAQVTIAPTIEEAIRVARELAQVSEEAGEEHVQVFITGSVHLVGGALEVLECNAERNNSSQK